MIFFAQGNGDDKTETFKEYFDDDFVYFKSVNGEDFKVDVPKLLEKKTELPELENLQFKQELVQPISIFQEKQAETSESPLEIINNPLPYFSSQSSATTNTSNNILKNSDSFFTSVKNFFHSLLSGSIALIGGFFTFN